MESSMTVVQNSRQIDRRMNTVVPSRPYVFFSSPSACRFFFSVHNFARSMITIAAATHENVILRILLSRLQRSLPPPF